ncbi:hypothetical protein F4809DRAFT_215329 [Biscogniauxia mediterranea]|nr:hypothetical protein F4809DRAFT_215329 [Biscogniauxia mediterranea]
MTTGPNNSTIRTVRPVPSFEAPSETDSSESPSARNSGFSSSVNSNVSRASDISNLPSTQSSSTVRLKPQSPDPDFLSPGSNGHGSLMSTTDVSPRGRENLADHSPLPDTTQVDDHLHDASNQWDGAVGKAGLGKTGRVINKLVSENEALKRDLQIERLKAEECKQAAKLLEDKMERMISDYESQLLEANITKTFLSRKERQVEQLQAAVELEKKRTADAQERERIWKEELEKGRRDTKVQVEEANAHAALMESRYNAISSHWKDQGKEVEQAASGLSGTIKSLVEERKKDDEKIGVLRDLCDQQDCNIRDLRRQKDEIGQQFEAYKREQEASLRHIKEAARQREEEQLRTIEETKRVLGQLRWALNVKRDVKGAQ